MVIFHSTSPFSHGFPMVFPWFSHPLFLGRPRGQTPLPPVGRPGGVPLPTRVVNVGAQVDVGDALVKDRLMIFFRMFLVIPK